MEFLIYSVLGGAILFAVISMATTSPGRTLQKKFAGMGTLSGRSLGEITAIAGSPSSVSAVGDGRTLHQWMATGYHIALIFDANENCEGVSHEFANA